MDNTNTLSSLIWSSADDVLRGLFKPSEYGRVILPFVVMRRLDCVLEPKKDEVYDLYTKFKDQLADPSPVILRQVGLPFFNTSKYDLSRIKSDPTNVLMNFNNYVQGYSENVLDIIENFSINPLDSSVFSEDSDSTPLISETLSFVTGCSYATIDNVSNAGVDRPLNIEGGLNSAKSDEIVLRVTKSEDLSSYFM